MQLRPVFTWAELRGIPLDEVAVLVAAQMCRLQSFER